MKIKVSNRLREWYITNSYKRYTIKGTAFGRRVDISVNLSGQCTHKTCAQSRCQSTRSFVWKYTYWNDDSIRMYVRNINCFNIIFSLHFTEAMSVYRRLYPSIIVLHCHLFNAALLLVVLFLTTSSCHPPHCRPLDLSPRLGCNSVHRLVHLLYFTCPAHFHFLIQLLGPNFQQKFAFGGRSVKFSVKILLTMLYVNIYAIKWLMPWDLGNDFLGLCIQDFKRNVIVSQSKKKIKKKDDREEAR